MLSLSGWAWRDRDCSAPEQKGIFGAEDAPSTCQGQGVFGVLHLPHHKGTEHSHPRAHHSPKGCCSTIRAGSKSPLLISSPAFNADNAQSNRLGKPGRGGSATQTPWKPSWKDGKTTPTSFSPSPCPVPAAAGDNFPKIPFQGQLCQAPRSAGLRLSLPI